MACNPRDYVAALENGLRTIEAFDAAEPSMTLAEVSAKTGLTRAAARRHLLTLTELGYMEHEGRHFRLTPRVIKLGHAYFSATSLPRLAQPYLDLVGRKTGEVASLAVLDGPDIVYIARSAPRRIVAVVGVGVRLPAAVTGTGRVLLANHSDDVIVDVLDQLGPIEKRTPLTKNSQAEIRAEIQFSRTNGYSINDEEIEIGLRSISVPVRAASQVAVAAMSVSTPPWRMSTEQMIRDFLPTLRESADQLGALLYS